MFRAAAFASLFGLVLLTGCGEDSSSSSSSSSSGSDSSSAPAAPTMSSTQAASDGAAMPNESYEAPMDEGGYDSTMADPMAGYNGYNGTTAGQPQQPPRPEKIEDWSVDHITSAITAGDNKAVQAIRDYAERHQGQPDMFPQILAWLQTFNDAAAATTTPNNPGSYGAPEYDSTDPGTSEPSGYIPPGEPGAALSPAEGSPDRFANLLSLSAVGAFDETIPYSEPPSDPSMYDPNMMYGSNPNQGGAGGRDAIGRELVEVLVGTRTLEGYSAARELLKGKLLTNVSDDKVVEWTIGALMKNVDGPYSPAKKILRQTLLEPELFRPEGPATDRYNADEFAQRSLLLHTAFSQAMVDGYLGVPENTKPKAASNPNAYMTENYMQPGFETDPMGYNPDGQPNPQPAAPQNNAPQLPKLDLPKVSMSPEAGRGAAYYFWDPEFAQFSQGQFRRVARFGQFPEAFLLAGQIPLPESRQAVREFLDLNWEQDAGWLKEQKVFSDHWRDPAILVYLKSLPREPRPMANNTADGSQPNQPRRPTRDKDTPAQKAAKHAWFDASQDYLLATMDRLAAAGHADDSHEFSPEELGIKLHKDAELTVQYRLQFPPADDDLGAFAGLEPTWVNYVRIESTQMDERTAKHYESAIRGEEKRIILAGNALWFDAEPRLDRVTKKVISTDIILSRNNARGQFSTAATQQPTTQPNYDTSGGQPGPGGVLVVEILTIIVPDPDAAPATEAVSSRE